MSGSIPARREPRNTMQIALTKPAPPESSHPGEVLYRILFEAASDCILVLDREGRLIDMNHRVCSVLGYSCAELMGQRFSRILEPQALARLYPRPAGLRVERRRASGEQEVRSRDGVVHQVEYTASPLPDGNVLLIVRDVTDRKRLEQERDVQHRLLERSVAERTAELQLLNRELESFSYSVSHDLRSPLRNIRGLVSVLRTDFGPLFSGEPQDTLECIERNAQRMERLIDDLLTFSQSRSSSLSTVAVDMRPLVEAAIKDHLPAWGNGTSVFISDLPACRGDPGLLRQVWDNLLGNAFKYSSRAASPQIEIGGERKGNALVYWVKDNGAGFDMTAADRLFEAFQRLHPERGFPGTGIGLATVKRIVERHGGAVSALGETGRGATFRFTLPDVDAVPMRDRRKSDRPLRSV